MTYDDTTQVTQRHSFALKELSKKQEEVRVVVLAGPLAGDKYEIEDELVIGRAPECHIRIDDALVSRRHARLEQHSALVAELVEWTQKVGELAELAKQTSEEADGES